MYRGHLTRTYSYLKARHRLSYNVNAANCRGGAIFIIKWGEARRYVRMSLRISEWYIVCKTEIRVQASLDYVSDADIDNVLLCYMYIYLLHDNYAFFLFLNLALSIISNIQTSITLRVCWFIMDLNFIIILKRVLVIISNN